jgi:hypothetical protein
MHVALPRHPVSPTGAADMPASCVYKLTRIPAEAISEQILR